MFSDSRLVLSQIKGNFEAKDYRMSQYLKLFGSLQVNFEKVNMVRMPRSQNSHANSLSTLASSSNECIPQMISVVMLK